ncbi:hypothetical protein [Streptomyces sp. NPDC050564]|uniref:hypothetical protein n=1 Tax=Streptomyces sp. NPDC050564 TaxID=3365631 RepID=UPI0037B7E8F7
MSQLPPNAWGPPPPPPPRPQKTVGNVAITAAAAAAAFFVAGAIGQSLNDEPSTSACKAALQRNYDTTETEIKAGLAPGPKDMPIECVGVDNVTLERYAGEIARQALEDAFSSATEQP